MIDHEWIIYNTHTYIYISTTIKHLIIHYRWVFHPMISSLKKRGMAAAAMPQELQAFQENRPAQAKPKEGNRFGPMSMIPGSSWIILAVLIIFDAIKFCSTTCRQNPTWHTHFSSMQVGFISHWLMFGTLKASPRIGFLLLLICVPGLCCWFCWIKAGTAPSGVFVKNE